MADYYAIDPEQISRLQAIAKRLYTENRMNGDEMRDAAHTITAVLRQVQQIPLTTDGKPATPAN